MERMTRQNLFIESEHGKLMTKLNLTRNHKFGGIFLFTFNIQWFHTHIHTHIVYVVQSQV